MTGFADAFRRGQDAAVLAEQSRAEIEGVLAAVKAELLQVTDGKLELAVRKFEKPKKKTAAALLGVTAIESLLDGMSKEWEPWVAARNPMAIDAEWVQLARWERRQEGYPCVLRYDSKDVRCHDRDALAGAIEELLATARIGESLRELVGRPIKQST